MKSRETNCRGRMRTLLAYRGDCRGSVLIGTLDWQRGNLQCFPMKTKVFQAHVPDFEISGNTPAQAIDRDSENVPVERDEIVSGTTGRNGTLVSRHYFAEQLIPRLKTRALLNLPHSSIRLRDRNNSLPAFFRDFSPSLFFLFFFCI